MPPDHRHPGSPWDQRRSIWLAAGLLAAVIALAYSNTFRVPFIFDDFTSISENQSLRQWRTWLSPPGNAGVSGRPLLNLSFGLNYACGTLNPIGYHGFNLAVHIVCALLVFGVVRRTVKRVPTSGTLAEDATVIALSVALLWSLHPLQTESVTYVSQRAESLAGVCALATLWMLVRGLDSPRRVWWLTGSWAACGVGMAMKETCVIIPVLVLAYDFFLVARDAGELWRSRWRYHLGLAATWILLGWLMSRSSLASKGVGFAFDIPLGENLLVVCGAFTHYLRLAIWPQGLVFDYGTFGEMAPFSGPGRLGLLGLVAVMAFLAVRRWSWMAFPVASFVILLAPTTSLVPLPSQPIAEHRLYLAVLGPIALIVVPLFAWRRRVAIWVAGALAVVAGGASFARNADYRSLEAIWRTTLERVPENPRARVGLARALADAGRFDEALALVRAGVEEEEQTGQLKITHGELHLTHGQLLQRQGDLERAEFAGRAALALMPDALAARTLLYRVYGAQGNLKQAHEQLEAALQLAPNDGLLWSDLCYVRRALGQLDQASRAGEEAVRLAPAYAGAHGNLAIVLLERGRVAEAVARHAAWQRLQPPDGPPNHEFATGLMKAGAWVEAEAELEAMLRRGPDDADALNYLGVVVLKRGDPARAQAMFERALRLRPDFKAARENLDALPAPVPDRSATGGPRSP